MTSIEVPQSSASPFDSIKRTDEDGEFWSARDLMPMLGYDSWDRVPAVIERAMAACNNTGHQAPDHFRGASKMVSIGSGATRSIADHHLTRFAAYLVAMNGDPRKQEIAEAQTYFAVKTREAETLMVNVKEITRGDMARMILAAEEELAIASAALTAAAPAIAYHDRFVVDSDVVVVKVWGAQFGLTEPQAYALLKEKGIVYRISLGERWSNAKGKREEVFEYRARAGRESFAWFDLRPQHNAPRHHNGQVRQTLYVRQGFALDLGKAAGLVAVPA